MKKKIFISIAVIAFISAFSWSISFTKNAQSELLSVNSVEGIFIAEAKVEGDWCSSGVKNKDEFYTYSFRLGRYVCSCEEDFDDCCRCN